MKNCWILDFLLNGCGMWEETGIKNGSKVLSWTGRQWFSIMCVFGWGGGVLSLVLRTPVNHYIMLCYLLHCITLYSLIAFHLGCVNSLKYSVINLISSPSLSPHSNSSFIKWGCNHMTIFDDFQLRLIQQADSSVLHSRPSIVWAQATSLALSFIIPLYILSKLTYCSLNIMYKLTSNML